MERGSVLLFFLPMVSLFGFFDQHLSAGDRNGLKGPAPLESVKLDPACTDCHSALVEKKMVHSPAKEGCAVCHQTNTADHPEKVAKGLLLTEKIPGLCYKCHDGVKVDIDTSRVVHQAVNTKRQCMNCHSPHSSDEKKLLVRSKKELCLQCHDKEVAGDGRKTTNIVQLLRTAKVVHPAINGGCTSCHMPHASAENYLLISAYPASRYAPGKRDNYAICWECHDSDLLDLEKTTTATSFRNGERNLHNVHLVGKKGRTCSVCHDVHASMQEHLIVDKVQYGEWEFPMNYLPSANGGSCAPGCHQQFKYTR